MFEEYTWKNIRIDIVSMLHVCTTQQRSQLHARALESLICICSRARPNMRTYVLYHRSPCRLEAILPGERASFYILSPRPFIEHPSTTTPSQILPTRQAPGTLPAMSAPARYDRASATLLWRSTPIRDMSSGLRSAAREASKAL